MNKELREIIRKYFKRHGIGNWKKAQQEALIKELEEQINPWHIQERKKWAIDIIEEAKKFLLTTQSISMSSKIGVGIAIAEIRKEVEEG